MRAAVVLLTVLAACTPDVFSESYYCGPDSSCPDGQACNGTDNICVLASGAKPFACASTAIMTEPDNTAAEAHALPTLSCQGVPIGNDNCMLENDAEDWVKLQVPQCENVQIESVLSFPFAFESLTSELWDLDQMTKLTDDDDCEKTGEAAGNDVRCITQPVVAGTNYGLKIRPAGGGDCDGNCRYNRYSLSVQLSTP